MNIEDKVSIVMNCFNGEAYLDTALQSIFNQTYQNWELIFWDNCSNDDSKKLLKKYNDKRIHYFKSETHTTQYEARKRAVEKCSGQLIAFLDVDDWWDSSKLVLQVSLFSDPLVGFVCCNYWIINERKKVKPRKAFKNIPSGYVTEQLLVSNFVGMSTLMIRKDAYFSLEYGFNPEYEIIGDYDLVLRLSERYKLASLISPHSYYRCHDKNLSLIKFDLNISELERWIVRSKKFQKYANFKYLKNFSLFYRGLIHIQNNKRIKAMQQFKNITSIYFKIKLFIVLIMPKWLIKMMRS